MSLFCLKKILSREKRVKRVQPPKMIYLPCIIYTKNYKLLPFQLDPDTVLWKFFQSVHVWNQKNVKRILLKLTYFAAIPPPGGNPSMLNAASLCSTVENS